MILWALLLTFHVHAKSSTKAAVYPRPPARMRCLGVALGEKECELKIKPMRVHVSAQKITWNDERWTSLTDFPVPVKKQMEWQSLSLLKLEGRWLMEISVWENSDHAVSVQHLHWIVTEITGQKMKVWTDQIIQRRRPFADGKRDQRGTVLRHGLRKAAGSKHWEWFAGKQKGSL